MNEFYDLILMGIDTEVADRQASMSVAGIKDTELAENTAKEIDGINLIFSE